jgi:hypothetical protein
VDYLSFQVVFITFDHEGLRSLRCGEAYAPRLQLVLVDPFRQGHGLIVNLGGLKEVPLDKLPRV